MDLVICTFAILAFVVGAGFMLYQAICSTEIPTVKPYNSRYDGGFTFYLERIIPIHINKEKFYVLVERKEFCLNDVEPKKNFRMTDPLFNELLSVDGCLDCNDSELFKKMLKRYELHKNISIIANRDSRGE